MSASNEVLFVSDLHLSLGKPAITQRFLNFLEQRAVRAEALYILGDLFDAWIGDDDNTPPNKSVKQALRRLSDAGTAVHLLQGNRDFLLGQRFAAETGVSLLPEYCVIELGGQPVLLTHGDLLCSDDVAYQAFRVKSRTAEWRRNVLSKSLWLRLLAARWYRWRSHYHKRGKTQDIMDVNQDTVRAEMRRFACQVLIHGHTHRPARHDFILDEKTATRWVLAEWRPEAGQTLCWRAGAWTVETV